MATAFAFNRTALLEHASIDLFLGLLLLVVLANVVYCAAYPVDVFVQLSGLDGWRSRIRRTMFAPGLLFASVIA